MLLDHRNLVKRYNSNQIATAKCTTGEASSLSRLVHGFDSRTRCQFRFTAFAWRRRHGLIEWCVDRTLDPAGSYLLHVGHVFHWDELLMRFSALVVLLALCCGLASGCSKGISRATAAAVLSVKGRIVFGN